MGLRTGAEDLAALRDGQQMGVGGRYNDIGTDCYNERRCYDLAKASIGITMLNRHGPSDGALEGRRIG